MKISLKITNIEAPLSSTLRTYLEKKLARTERAIKSFGQSPKVWVELARSTKHHRSGDIYYAEADLRLPGKVLRVESTAGDIRSAIDIMADELFRQARDYKGKLRSKYLSGARHLKQKLQK